MYAFSEKAAIVFFAVISSCSMFSMDSFEKTQSGRNYLNQLIDDGRLRSPVDPIAIRQLMITDTNFCAVMVLLPVEVSFGKPLYQLYAVVDEDGQAWGHDLSAIRFSHTIHKVNKMLDESGDGQIIVSAPHRLNLFNQ